MKTINKILLIFLIIHLFILSYSKVYATEINIQSNAAVLIDKRTGRILFQKNCRERLKVASLTKIITAIVAVENCSLDEVVNIGKGPAYIGGSVVGLKYGSNISLRKLMYGMLLESGNDCALAIAEHVSGSKEKFAILMNQKAKEIGAKDSYFSNPHGLDEEKNHSTAFDMALIFRYAINNEYLSQILSTNSISLDFGGVNKSLSNTNRLLRTYGGCIGGKTGFTNGANRCLIAAAKDKNMEVIAVILGAPTTNIRFNEGKQLLLYGLEEYRYMDISNYINFYINIKIIKGDIDYYTKRIKNNMIIPLKGGELEEIYVKQNIIPILNATVKKGTYLGNVEMYIGSEKIYNEDVILDKDIYKKNVSSYIKEGLKNIFNIQLELY